MILYYTATSQNVSKLVHSRLQNTIIFLLKGNNLRYLLTLFTGPWFHLPRDLRGSFCAIGAVGTRPDRAQCALEGHVVSSLRADGGISTPLRQFR